MKKYMVLTVALDNVFTGAKTVRHEVRDEDGALYGTLADLKDAEIVAYGLNNGFQEHFLGGFSDSEIVKIETHKAQSGAAQ